MEDRNAILAVGKAVSENHTAALFQQGGMAMQQRTLGRGLQVSALGLGCMGMSEFYGPRDDALALQTLDCAIEAGIDMLDTADIYGPHHNEELIGRFLASRRPRVKIATKFGIVRQAGEYRRGLDNSPQYARQSCEDSLRRLGVERIDLYYVHRVDAARPIEETMQGLARLVQEGKIARIGLCEVSAATLRRAHAVHPVAAVQTEYSLWTREVEDEVLPACRELGVGLVAYSPLGRGFLTGRFHGATAFEPGDFRASLPRFQPGNIDTNQPWWAPCQPWRSTRAAHLRRSPWPGCWPRGRTWCPFPEPAALPTCRTTWGRCRWPSRRRNGPGCSVPATNCPWPGSATRRKA
jgi:aryl-alcohol dehydrogenase-like predicted oxidoreductase